MKTEKGLLLMLSIKKVISLKEKQNKSHEMKWKNSGLNNNSMIKYT